MRRLNWIALALAACGGGTTERQAPDGGLARPDGAALTADAADVTTGNVAWDQVMGGAMNDRIFKVAADADGNVYVAGVFFGSITFSDGDMISVATGQTHSSFVVKLGPSGNPIWHKTFTGSGDQGAEGIAVVGTTNVIVTGPFQSDIDLGAGSISGGGDDVFVVELRASDGGYVWGTTASDVANQDPHEVAVAADGSSVVVGNFEGTLTWGATTLTAASGTGSGFVLGLTAGGAPSWAHDLVARDPGGAPIGFQTLVGVAIRPGEIAVTGTVKGGSADFGAGPLSAPGDANGDLVVGLYDSSGNLTRAVQLGDGGTQRGRGLGFDGSGNLFVAGDSLGVIALPAGGSVGSTNAGPVVLALDAQDLSIERGVGFASTCSAPCTDVAYPYGLAVDGAGDVIFGGYVIGSLPVGATTLTAQGTLDAFVVKLEGSTLATRWAHAYGASGATDAVATVAVDATGNVSAAGGFGPGILFDPTHFAASVGGSDGFVVELAP